MLPQDTDKNTFHPTQMITKNQSVAARTMIRIIATHAMNATNVLNAKEQTITMTVILIEIEMMNLIIMRKNNPMTTVNVNVKIVT